MTLPENIKNILKNDWFIAFSLFLIFLATNGYTYAWDDQHIEIPLLKSLIDPRLYVGDYYVESLKHNFTSYLFPILAKLITVPQVPTTYFILYLISRFFLFFYSYKLWKLITRKEFTAMLCVLSFILIGRVEEFLYRTFSHQEFSLAIIMAAMYYFYKNRYLLAAVLFGIAANFHALYSLFPFCYMAFYLLWHAREDKGERLLKSIGLFALFASPFIIWTIKRYTTHGIPDSSLYVNWLDLYKIACSQNFLFQDQSLADMFRNFKIFLRGTEQFWPVLALLGLNLTHNSTFRQDKKSQSLIIAASGFILLSFIFTYIIPNRFILDLNLVRNLQYMLFILMGYTTILVLNASQSITVGNFVVLVGLFSLIRFGNYVCFWAVIGMLILLYKPKTSRLHLIRILGFLLSLGIIIYLLKTSHLNSIALKTFYVSMVILGLASIWIYRSKTQNPYIPSLFILIPMLTIGGNFIYYHYLHLKIESQGGGFWQLQRNWIDMQNYVRNNTPKNAVILTPNDMEMGGFRIFSERKVVCCYRDCGIIGFDYAAAVEWQKRLKDIEHFKVMVDGDIAPAIRNAIFKYHANYIVFMRYLKPKPNALMERVYENDIFVLFKILN